MNLYQEILMDHYRHPRNRGICDAADFLSERLNPSCGDQIQFAGRITEGSITTLCFDGRGCVISQATASMLSESLKDKPIEDILGLDKDFVLSMIGMQLGPTRLKCALLPLQALQAGIVQYQGAEKRGVCVDARSIKVDTSPPSSS